MLAEGPAEAEVQRFGSTVAGAVPVMSAQYMASPHSAGMVAQWPELADVTLVTSSVRRVR